MRPKSTIPEYISTEARGRWVSVGVGLGLADCIASRFTISVLEGGYPTIQFFRCQETTNLALGPHGSLPHSIRLYYRHSLPAQFLPASSFNETILFKTILSSVLSESIAK